MTTPILLVGTGALATLFAARLSAAGKDVTILGTWSAGLAELRKNGACLDGEGKYPVHATDNPMDCKGTKLALVLVKSWQTERAAEQLVSCLAKDGLAVTFQNGLGNDEILSGILGCRRVSRGITTLGATLLAPGIVRLSGWGEIILEAHSQIKMLKAALRVANFTIDVVEDLNPVIWGKLVVNAAINPLTALLKVKNGELLNNQPARELMGRLACETAEVAMALGVRLPFSDPELAAEEVAQQTAQNSSSMLQDVQRGAQTEVDVINGMVVRIGNLHQITTPVNQVVWSLIKALPRPGKL
jgi:2-dehydropantoate 2-reductase